MFKTTHLICIICEWNSLLLVFSGCPFKHTDADLLKQGLKSLSLGDNYLEKVCIRCTLVFHLFTYI